MSSDSDKLDMLLQDGAVIKKQLENLEGDVDTINTKLFLGNGKASVISRLEIVELHVSKSNFLSNLLIGSLFTGVIGLVLVLIEKVG